MIKRLSVVLGYLILGHGFQASAQVSAVEFGKNRVQYEKFDWRYYQTNNFHVYFSQDGLGLGKYVAQVAELELPQIENFVEYGLQRRVNLVVYNNFDEMQQSNIGAEVDWQNSGGVTKMVNNKVVVYFDGNHENLRIQIRQGIARVLVDNILFGDDLGEFAANKALLDLPKWLTDGYVAYAAENWSPALDNDLRSIMLSSLYKNFYQFAHEKPLLAGHAFWKYFADKYGKNKVTYFLYLSRIYRNTNNAAKKVAGKKFKDILSDFMNELPPQYFKDMRGRKNIPKGQLSVVNYIDKKDYIRFNANPVPRSFTYGVVEYNKGKYNVVLVENFTKRNVLLRLGTKMKANEANPNLPILAWDNKGTRLAVVYWKEGKLRLFVYDAFNKVKMNHVDLPMFDQVQDVKYMLDQNTLLFSAVRSGQTDIYVYKIDKGTYTQITNDVYDDLDPAFVAFPNKTGIIFSSNRPTANAPSSEDSIPSNNNFNIFLVDNWNQSDFKQISQLTNVQLGNARFPSQYNETHFTFVSDENGINNRYAGFFKTERSGLDTLVFIGDEILRNPLPSEVDSVLKDWEKSDIDSVAMVSITSDSSYVFPLTNYQSSLLETRTSGENQLVSEVVKMGEAKMLYRLRVDENTLKRRNVTSRPTEYMKQVIDEARRSANVQSIGNEKPVAPPRQDFFQTEFEDDKTVPATNKPVTANNNTNKALSILEKAKVYEYRPRKYFIDYAVTNFNNTVFAVNRFQPYMGGSGPINLSNGGDFNGMLRVSTSDLMEDVKFTGGIRIAPNLRDNDILFYFQNLKKRIDWGILYYRGVTGAGFSDGTTNFPGKSVSNYLLGTFKYPLDRTKSIKATIGPRFDNIMPTTHPSGLIIDMPDIKSTYGQISLEYVYDNVITKTPNIWDGLRYKIYIDLFNQISNSQQKEGKTLFNAGFDARHYLPLFRNLTWAVRGAGDFSFGEQRVLYYLGGMDNWLGPKFNNNNRPVGDYTYQSLAVNMRGFRQNIAHGTNAFVLNSEVRLPVFTTLLNRPINNAMLRNFQLVQFIDLGTAWNGGFSNIKRPSEVYTNNEAVTVRFKSGGIGPLVGGYGFGARTMALGQFVRFDVAWEMDGVFRGKPMYYFGLGFDF